ncbi:hypothetical protein N325_12782, partial [Colius striatus]
QCSFFFVCFNSTSEMTTFFHSTLKKPALNPVQLKRYTYKTFCKKKSRKELMYLNTP